MAFNPYGSFLDFSQKDWSVEDEDLKSTGRKGDSADAHKKRQSSPELIIPVQIPLNEEQDADLKRTKSIRSDPETSVTAALTEHHESFSFEINLPPALDVSPLSCKESVIASMMSRSVDRALESPPLMIRTSVPHEKRSRARSKSRSRETSQNPTVRRGRKEPGEAFLGLSEKNGRSHSKETTLLPSWDKQAEGRSRSRSRAPVDLPISDGVSRSHSKERKRASSRERYSAKTTRSRSIDPTLGSENYGGSPSKEKQYEPSPLKDRRKGHSSRSRSIDHSSKFFAEDHGPSKSKDWKLSSPDANHSERSSRSRSTDPTHRSRDSDVRRRIRTRSTSVARSKEEDFSKRSQSKVRVHIMEEIREKNGHSSPSPSRRSPSRSRHHAQSTAEPQSSTSSSRARSKSRPRHKDKSSPRGDTGLPLASLDENDLAVIKELTVFSSLKEGVPPPPPSMDTHFSSPRSKPKNAEARRSKHNRTSGNHDSAHEITGAYQDGPEDSPRNRASRRRSSRRNADSTSAGKAESKGSHKSKWLELQQLNQARRSEESTKAGEGLQRGNDDPIDTTKVAKVTLGADFREALKTKTTPSPSHQVDFTGLVSPRVSTQDKLDDDGLIVVQPRLQNVLIRLKQTSTTIDDGTSGIHNKPPASPSLSSPSQRKSLQNLFVKTKSSRIGSVASGKGSHGSHEEQSKHCSSRVPNSGCKTKESKSVASGKASTSSSQAGTESDHSQSQNIIDKTKDETGLQKVLPTHSMERFEAEEEPINDAILMAPKLTDVVLHGRNAPKIPPKSTRKGSPSLPRKTISESSEPSEFGNYDRLKRANDLIQEQRRKKEESRSRQKELEEQNIALEQSPTILKKEIAYVVSMPDKPTGSPRRAGWGLLKSMKGSSTTQLSNDRSEQQQSDTVALDLPSKVTELQGTKQFEEIKPKSNRRRSHPEDSADTCKPSSSKWKDLSARLESQDNAKATMGSDSPGSKSKYARKNEGRKTSDQSPGTLSPGRLSKWTGLRGARKFMSNVGRQGEHHRLLLDDDDE